jgi:NAD(P)H-hydrate epimerase
MPDVATIAEIPAISGNEMARIDQIMAGTFGVTSLQLMELAGHAVATYARDHLLHGDAAGKHVLVLSGSGGNGGDGMVAARLLQAWGAHPHVYLNRAADKVEGDAAHQLATLRALAVPIDDPGGGGGHEMVLPTAETNPSTLPEADLIIDGLLGLGVHGAPTGRTAELIRATNAAGAPILAVDIPSGLDATTGEIATPCVRAKVTLSIGLPKRGLREPTARAAAGQVVVADIGIPPQAYEKIGIHVPATLFAQGSFREWLPT